MSQWRLEVSRDFEHQLRKLDNPIRQRVARYLDELLSLEDPRQRGKGLTANRSGYWRYRVGDYRLLAEIRDDELVIIAVELGHRSEVY
ncbi:type II toxin-antitoxin system RelE family toxin [Plantibacter sp. YIM 135347]|uniref:type II toxin-antitoxin system RelE family toxin n=1 Tax=Plantibacter sp. YIM 135347 TaxID=3423919 RepID=UPI003D335920